MAARTALTSRSRSVSTSKEPLPLDVLGDSVAPSKTLTSSSGCSFSFALPLPIRCATASFHLLKRESRSSRLLGLPGGSEDMLRRRLCLLESCERSAVVSVGLLLIILGPGLGGAATLPCCCEEEEEASGLSSTIWQTGGQRHHGSQRSFGRECRVRPECRLRRRDRESVNQDG